MYGIRRATMPVSATFVSVEPVGFERVFRPRRVISQQPSSLPAWSIQRGRKDSRYLLATVANSAHSKSGRWSTGMTQSTEAASYSETPRLFQVTVFSRVIAS